MSRPARPRLLLAVAVLAAAGLFAPPVGASECDRAFGHDDGRADTGVGVDRGVTVMWLSHFRVPGVSPLGPPCRRGPLRLTEIGLAWWQLPAGVPTEVVVYDDPDGDGDPSDARLRLRIGLLSAATEPDDLAWLELREPLRVGPPGGSFFVGAAVVQSAERDFPAPLDTTGLRARAGWVVASADFEPLDFDDLAANPIGPLRIDDACSNCAGNWRLRVRLRSATQESRGTPGSRLP